jgi:hypothetical protein
MPLSQNPKAKYARDRRLQDDEFANRCLQTNRRIHARKRLTALAVRASVAADAKLRHGAKAFLERLRHHLAKGRDAGDIAIREGIKVSVVVAAMQQIAGQPTQATSNA